MSAITSANLANAILKLVAAEALPALMGNFQMGGLVNRDFEPLIETQGNTINIPIPATMTATNIAEGGSVTPQNPSLGNAQIVLNSHVTATFNIPDVTKAIAFPGLMKAYMEPALIAVATRVEGDLFNLYSSLTVNTPQGTGGTAITEAVIDTAETELFSALCPPSQQRWMGVSATTYSQLRSLATFKSWTNTGQAGIDAIVAGEIAEVKGVKVFRSQYVPVTGSGPATTHNLMFTRDAFGLVIRRLPQPLPGTGAIAEYAELGNFGFRVVMSYQPNTLAQQFTVDILYGCGVLRDAFAVPVLT